jgi:hypothetical protein
MPARIRIMADFSIPSFMAMASAVLKPMPRISRASQGLNITCGISAVGVDAPPRRTDARVERKTMICLFCSGRAA